MGCRKDIAQREVEKDAHHLLPVKANQSNCTRTSKTCLPAVSEPEGMAWPTATTNR